MRIYDLIIIGAGPAGLAAGIQAAHLGLNHLVIEDPGQPSRLLSARKVENFPKLNTSDLSGEKLQQALLTQAMKKGAAFKSGTVRAVSKTKGIFVIATDKGSIKSHSVIMAVGLTPKKLDKRIVSRPLEDKRLFYRWNDIPFSKNNDKVLVIGGGEVAFDQACSLAEKGFKVTIAIRGKNDRVYDSLRREARALGVAIIYSTRIMRISETQKGIKATLKNADRMIERHYDHCLPAIGSTRNIPDLSPSAKKYLNAGLYLAGDAAHPKIKQAAIAFGDGIRRTIEAYEYIRNSSK